MTGEESPSIAKTPTGCLLLSVKRGGFHGRRQPVGKKYLRPAAVAAGVISADDNSRFGWHNLRHSLATFFGSNGVHPSVIQTMLRHSKQRTTARYIHPVNSSQLDAQGLYLDAIKIRGKRKKASGIRRSRVESRVGKGRRKRSKVLKIMVGPCGLEPQTSTMSR